jgi:histidine kinase
LAESGSDELSELTHNFNRMAAALAEVESTRRQLLGDISHELKTPLSSIKGYMEGLQDGVIPASDDTFQLVYREADRLQRLVLDLQQLVRLETALNLQPCSAEKLVKAAVARLQPQFLDKQVSLDAHFAPELPPVMADFDRIVQVLLNVIGNALQYTPAGGYVQIETMPDDKNVRFSVCDSGIGLVPEDLERIFQRFYRVDKSRSRLTGGSGIGLTIARSIVEAHQGKIWAASAGLGAGSTFYLTLPVALNSVSHLRYHFGD